MAHNPTIAILSLSGSLPGLSTVHAVHEETGRHLTFQAYTTPASIPATPELPWRAIVETEGRPRGEASSHLGAYEALQDAMRAALTD